MKLATNLTRHLASFPKAHKKLVLGFLFFLLVTVMFMWPMVRHAGTYSDGGDHMFNAWTLARNHNCLLGRGCEKYVDGNIFYPNKDTMLYSETQLSAGILTLPLYLINNNPLFAVNVWYVISTLLSGFFMFLLAMHLSKGKLFLSIVIGLIFEFAPTRITAMAHLQNQSIFYLPLLILLLLKFIKNPNKKYLIGYGIGASLFFMASWYQMVFGLAVIVPILLILLLSKNLRRKTLTLGLCTVVAIGVTLPLAKEYMRFSKQNSASFSLASQIDFSANTDDYFTPYQETPFGALYYKLRPHAPRNSHNPDSYSYSGITLYVIAGVSLIYLILKRREKDPQRKYAMKAILICYVTALIGLIISLGPVIKYSGHYLFDVQGYKAFIPAPYIIVIKLLPQLSFIRALGRASVLLLFALCSITALLVSLLAPKIRSTRGGAIVYGVVLLLIVADLIPVKHILTGPFMQIPSQKTSYSIPAVYEYIRQQDVDHILIIRTEKDYPGVGTPTIQAEDVLWAGYDNKSIFNGYSGYEPKGYQEKISDFNDLDHQDIAKLQTEGIGYVLVDKQLSATSLNESASALFGKAVYSDTRYSLYPLQPTIDTATTDTIQ